MRDCCPAGTVYRHDCSLHVDWFNDCCDRGISPTDVLQWAVDSQGASITLAAFTQNPTFAWFKYVLYLAVFLFAYSTCVSWSYYGERCFVSLFGQKSSLFYKCLFLTFTFLGSIVSPTNILEFSDMLILSMSIPNLLGVFLMSGMIKSELDRYWARYKSGELKK